MISSFYTKYEKIEMLKNRKDIRCDYIRYNNDIMGAEQSKCKCIWLPAQSGKTRKTKKRIETYKKISELFEPVDINIIISSNSLLLVDQTKTRMKKDLATESEEGADDACIKGGVFSWTSGTKESNITADHLHAKIALGDIEMVVICANATRLRYLSQTLELLAARKTFTKRINIWIDEADRSMNLWSKYENILAMRCINEVTLISATFDAVLSKYKALYILPYFKTHPDCYRGLRNAVRHEDNFATHVAPDYVKHVIETNVAHLTKPGMRAFIPGSVAKASHDAIAEFLHKEHNFVVLVVNGDRKEILVPGQDSIDIECCFTIENGQPTKEFNEQLAKLYKQNNWSRFPLAIVGFLCIGRGITFQIGPKEGEHDGFLFDYGIIPPMKSSAEAYQIMARLFGNVGDIPTYKPVEIYANAATFSHVEKKEEIAINIARMVAEQGLEVVTKKHLKAAEAPHKRVPVLVELSDDQFKDIMSVTEDKRKSLIVAIIMSSVQDDSAAAHEFRNVVSTSVCFQISTPGVHTKRSYKIHITDVVAASLGNNVYGMMDLDKEMKKATCWQIYIDTIEKRLVALWQVFN
jgi:hypothetical protein